MVVYLENVFSTVELNPILDSTVKQVRHAFVFINTENSSSDSALASAINSLRKIDEVKEIYQSRGAYEIVAKVSGESLDYLREIVSNRIKNLTNVRSTLTLMVIDHPEE